MKMCKHLYENYGFQVSQLIKVMISSNKHLAALGPLLPAQGCEPLAHLACNLTAKRRGYITRTGDPTRGLTTGQLGFPCGQKLIPPQWAGLLRMAHTCHIGSDRELDAPNFSQFLAAGFCSEKLFGDSRRIMVRNAFVNHMWTNSL